MRPETGPMKFDAQLRAAVENWTKAELRLAEITLSGVGVNAQPEYPVRRDDLLNAKVALLRLGTKLLGKGKK